MIRTLYFSNVFQGKGYMKTYWLKGKKDLSFKTPAELRYSSEQKDSEDKSSNGWVDNKGSSQQQNNHFLLYRMDSGCPLLIQLGLCSLPPAAPDSEQTEWLL